MPGWNQLTEGLREQIAEQRAAQLSALSTQANRLEATLKSNHRWLNRTGVAEAGLFARAEQTPVGLTLTVGARGGPGRDGGPNQGLYLQVAHFTGYHPHGRRFYPALPMTWDSVTPPTPYANIHGALTMSLVDLLEAIHTP